MEFKALLNDDDAVSPVIGVILMVAITVILAAVIGTFVLGLGDQVQQTAPNTQLGFEYNEDFAVGSGHDSLQITHEGGQQLNGNEVSARLDGAVVEDAGASPSRNPTTKTSDVLTATTYNAGSSETLDEANVNVDPEGDGDNGYLDLSGATVTVVWNAQGGDSSSTIKTWEGPDA